MCRRSTGPATRRAVIAVAALYALLLQAFLGALAPLPAQRDGLAALCAEHAGPDAPKDKAACRAHGCCLPAQAPQLVVPAPVAAPVRPRRVAEVVLRPPERAALPRAPPETRPEPRGPPASS